jgi:hypothetical protein
VEREAICTLLPLAGEGMGMRDGALQSTDSRGCATPDTVHNTL